MQCGLSARICDKLKIGCGSSYNLLIFIIEDYNLKVEVVIYAIKLIFIFAKFMKNDKFLKV